MALRMGVDYHLFWQLNPRRLQPFVKAYQEEQKAQLERANFAAWLSGIYVTHSIAASLGENARYPEKPIDLYETEEELESRKAREAELFSAYVDMFNKNFESRK